MPSGKSAKKEFLVEIILDLIEPEGSQDDDVNPILAPIYVRLRDLKNRLFDFQFSVQGLQNVRRVRRVRLGVWVDTIMDVDVNLDVEVDVKVDIGAAIISFH